MRPALVIPLVVIGLTAQELAAQHVRGRVVDEATGAPVGAAFVTVVREDGSRLVAFLTGTDGAFAFDVPAAGRFLIRSERIGHASAQAGPVDVARADTVFVEIRAPAAAVPLGAIEVRRGGRCSVRPEPAAAAARVWHEVRKALEITRWSSQGADLQFNATSYNRRLDPSGNITGERAKRTPSTGYRSWFPINLAVLDTIGYINQVGDTLEYYAPDAEVLLSDHFLDRHCIEAVAADDDRDGLIGLRFRPVPGRTLPEIRGTLWLNASTSELRFLEYEYVHAEHLVPIERARGRIDFARTESGIWYVDRWWIRMPHIVQNGRSYELRGWAEQGGFVLDVADWSRSRSSAAAAVETTPAAAFGAPAPQIFP